MSVDLQSSFLTLHEFIKAAKMRLKPDIWDYLTGGTETETTLRRNRMALDQIALRPRILKDVSNIDPGATVLGKKVRLPVVLAPIGGLVEFDGNAGVTVAQGADEFGVAMTLSSVNQVPPLEDVRAAGKAPQIFQLYVRGDDGFVDEYASRAIESGYDAFCITVDTAVYSRRERDIARRFQKPWRKSATGTEYQAAFSWKNVERFKAKHKIPFMLKGIATAEDTRIAVEHGVDYVWVSNHGGRQLDHGRGSMDVLDECMEAAGGKARFIVDGGFCRGTDIVKAMAMGVEAIAMGRLYCYAMAAAGAPGIVRMLEILEDETKSAMGLTGVTSWDQLDKSYLHFGAPAVCEPHVHSAYPLLGLDDPGYGGR